MPFGLLWDDFFMRIALANWHLVDVTEVDEIYVRQKKCFIHEKGSKKKKNFRPTWGWESCGKASLIRLIGKEFATWSTASKILIDRLSVEISS